MNLQQGFAAGYGCLAAWSDLLDRINVFPVADGDTGANLQVSLAPLRDPAADPALLPQRLGRCAIGNSGNIAAAFFREFCMATTVLDLAQYAADGCEASWRAVAEPRPGTMLTVFDSLAASLAETIEWQELVRRLASAVRETMHHLPALREAGVVDAGALGMFIFFAGFFRELAGDQAQPLAITELFAGQLRIRKQALSGPLPGYCVDLRLRPDSGDHVALRWRIAGLGDSVVIGELDGAELKVHVHTADPAGLRGCLGDLGEIVDWSHERIEQHAGADQDGSPQGLLHIMTDAAASLPRDLARQLDITLLDSYIVAGGEARPESLHDPKAIYTLLRAGQRVTTAQASNLERFQHYDSVCRRFGPTLYLATGSAYTGNHTAALAWKTDHDPDNLLQVMDSGAASGRLALMALCCARFARKAGSGAEVLAYAQKLMELCEEFVFIDQLRYLVAGGRVSRASGLFAGLLHLKPVISPLPEGVRKLGVVHSREGQLDFALARLQERFPPEDAVILLVQYSDNRDWVEGVAAARLRQHNPTAEILCLPLSLSSGVHMGPGTWSLACCPAGTARS